MRTKIRSLMRQLEKDFTVDFNVCQNSAELGAGLESLFRLHEKRWMSKGEKGVFASHAKRNFYKELSHLLLGRGWLRFYTLAVNNLPVAHQYCFEYRNTMFLLQEGFDPEWDHYGVGNVLRSYVFRDCTERRVIAYDFLGGITDHKISWGAVPKNSVNAAALKPAVKNRLFLAVPDAVAAGKSQLRAMLPERVFRWRESWKRRRSGLTSQSQSTARKAPSESVRHSETEL